MGTMDVVLTEIGKRWLQDHYSQGIVWEYDVDKPFKIHAWAAEFIELTYLGISYRIPPDVDGARATTPARSYNREIIIGE